MSTFSGPSYSEKETGASLFVISYMHPGITLVPVADSVTDLAATRLAVTSFASHLARFCVLGKRSTVYAYPGMFYKQPKLPHCVEA